MKKLTLLFGAVVLALTSCSKTDNASADAPVLIKTVSDGTDPVATFTYNGNKIVKDEYNSTYTYTGDLITSEVMTNGKSSGRNDYTYDGNGKLISQVSSGNSGTGADLQPTSKMEYTYNADGTVIVQDYDYSDSKFTESGTRKYTFANGNLIKDEHFDVDGTKNGEYDYEYDSKSNPLYNIKGFNNLVTGRYCKNNITKVAYAVYPAAPPYTDVSTNVYTYNEKGYPLTEQTTRVIYNGALGGSPTTTTVNCTFGY